MEIKVLEEVIEKENQELKKLSRLRKVLVKRSCVW